MSYRVRVNTPGIASLFGAAGDVAKVARRDSLQIIVRADAIAPVGIPRAGQRPIKGSHRRRVVPRSATLETSYYVENTSDHAKFVHEGTSGPIYPIGDHKLRLELPRGWVFTRSVRGQRSQPWLRNAANGVLFKYGVRV